MKIAVIAGSRCLTDRTSIMALLPKGLSHLPFKLDAGATGCARGVDSIAREWLIEHRYWHIDIPVSKRLARESKRNFMLRNNVLLEVGHGLLALRSTEDERARGTIDIVNKFKKSGKPTVVMHIEEMPSTFKMIDGKVIENSNELVLKEIEEYNL